MTYEQRNGVAESFRGHKKRLISFSSILAGLLVASVIGYAHIKETPRYNLYQFKRAILKHDAESALKYLDTDTIIDNAVKEMFHRPGETKKNDIGKEIVMQNLPSLKKQLREQLSSYIASYGDHTMLDTLSQASILGLNITTEGDIALVRIHGKDTIAFRMAKSQEGHWKIVAININNLAGMPGMNK